MNKYRIYVACLAAYNCGYLHGEWIEVNGKDGDDLREEVALILKTSPVGEECEEWAIHDYEGIPNADRMNLDDIADFVGAVINSDYDPDLLAEVCQDRGCDIAQAIEHMGNTYAGHFDSLEDWAMQDLEDNGDLLGIPESLRYYFDYASYARDEEANGNIHTIYSGRSVHVFRGN